ncbi:MAG: hypothetical protein F4Z42_06290 [Holophagales bacterium]|nr:hypothetical protein [Holophagales bacterium]
MTRSRSKAWTTACSAALVAAGILVPAGLAAQQAGDLLTWRGVASAAVTEYRYDNGGVDGAVVVSGVDEQEFVQRFRLRRAGTVTSATACFSRHPEAIAADVSFAFTFYRDSGGRPGGRLASYRATGTILADGKEHCISLDRGDITGQRLTAGDTWLGVRWPNIGSLTLLHNFLVVDKDGPGGTKNFKRHRFPESDRWEPWRHDTGVTAYLIRLGVEHDDAPTPSPDPEPEPPAPGCTPNTTALEFDGGYRVSLCYVTPGGAAGEGKAGIWASGQAGLLWFFDRGNAEVLIKVLDGCDHNGYRWVFVAPVTDLEFNLWVTGPNGRRWTHSNTQGATAATKSDTRAFSCSDEGT